MNKTKLIYIIIHTFFPTFNKYVLKYYLSEKNIKNIKFFKK